MLTDFSTDELIQSIDDLICDLLAAAAIFAPPVDAIALARTHLKIDVRLDNRQTSRGRVKRDVHHRSILVRPEPTAERQQWTVAHEIGEHFKSEVFCRLRTEPNDEAPMLGEMIANYFANRLLVPGCWFQRDAQRLDFDLLALKHLYRTSSHEVIALRMLDLPNPCIVSIIDNGRLHRRLSNAWPIGRGLQPIEQKCQADVHSKAVPIRLQRDGWTVHGWPVHQPDWKREILRTEVDSE